MTLLAKNFDPTILTAITLAWETIDSDTNCNAWGQDRKTCAKIRDGITLSEQEESRVLNSKKYRTLKAGARAISSFKSYGEEWGEREVSGREAAKITAAKDLIDWANSLISKYKGVDPVITETTTSSYSIDVLSGKYEE